MLNLTLGCLTVTLQVTEVLSAVTVTVAAPGFFAKMTPFSSTETILDLLDLNLGACPVETTASSLLVSPFSIEMLFALSWMVVFCTVTLQLASPFLIFAVIMAVPAFFAVIFP